MLSCFFSNDSYIRIFARFHLCHGIAFYSTRSYFQQLERWKPRFLGQFDHVQYCASCLLDPNLFFAPAIGFFGLFCWLAAAADWNWLQKNRYDYSWSREKNNSHLLCLLEFSFISLGVIGIIFLNNHQIMNDFASDTAFGPYVRYVEFLFFCSSLTISVFCSAIDIVPSFVYYRAGLVLQVLVDRWESFLLQRDSAKVQRIVAFYNSIGNLVTRADYLFGPLIVINHGTTFFFICTLTSTIVKPSLWTQSDSFRNILFGNLIFFLARLIWPVMFMSKLYGSSERLKAIVLSSFSNTIAEDHPNKKSSTTSITLDKSIKKFAFLLVNKSLLACPNGLYSITPSILLTMLSLLATYTIIILQSK